MVYNMIKNINISLRGDALVVVSFEIASEEHLISGVAIRMGVDGRDFATYVDDTGVTREWLFYLPSLHKAIQLTSLLYAAICIEDAEGVVHTFNATRMLALENGYPVINNVRVAQRVDGSGLVDIWYDYFNQNEINLGTATLEISNDSGASFNVPVLSAVGDLGSGVSTGTSRHVIWNPRVDTPTLGRQDIIVRISLVDERGISAVGNRTAGLVQINIDKPRSYVIFKQDDEKPQHGIFSGEDIKNKYLTVYVLESSSRSSISSSSLSSSSSYIQLWSSSSSSDSSTSVSSPSSTSVSSPSSASTPSSVSSPSSISSPSSDSSQSTSSWAAMAALSGSGGPVAANQNYEIQGTFGGKDWYRTQDTLYSIWWHVVGIEWIISNSPPDPALSVWWFGRSNANPFGSYSPIYGTGNPVLIDLFASSSSVSSPSSQSSGSSISSVSSLSNPSSVSSDSSPSSESESSPSSSSISSSVWDLWSSSSGDLLHCTGDGVPAPNGTYFEAFVGEELFYAGKEPGISAFRIYDAGGTWVLRDFISNAHWINGVAGTPIGTYSPFLGGATGNPIVSQTP